MTQELAGFGLTGQALPQYAACDLHLAFRHREVGAAWWSDYRDLYFANSRNLEPGTPILYIDDKNHPLSPFHVATVENLMYESVKYRSIYHLYQTFACRIVGIPEMSIQTPQRAIYGELTSGEKIKDDAQLKSILSRLHFLPVHDSRYFLAQSNGVTLDCMAMAVYAQAQVSPVMRELLLYSGHSQFHLRDPAMDKFWTAVNGAQGFNWYGVVLGAVRARLMMERASNPSYKIPLPLPHVH